MAIDLLHGLFADANALVIDRFHEANEGGDAVVGHGGSITEHGLHGVEQAAAPMLLEHPPTAFDGVVLAQIGRIVGQHELQAGRLSERDESGKKLGSVTVVFRSVVKLQHQGVGVGKPVSLRLPERFEGVDPGIGRSAVWAKIDV